MKIIAGEYRGTKGPISGGATDPYYFDIQLAPGATFEAALPSGHNAFVYAYEGEATIGEKTLPHRAAGILADGDGIRVSSASGARLLLLAGRPLREPVVQYGPFVMNSVQEIEQAIRDYQSGSLAA